MGWLYRLDVDTMFEESVVEREIPDILSNMIPRAGNAPPKKGKRKPNAYAMGSEKVEPSRKVGKSKKA